MFVPTKTRLQYYNANIVLLYHVVITDTIACNTRHILLAIPGEPTRSSAGEQRRRLTNCLAEIVWADAS